jgi:hypothetical protein
MKIIDNIIVKVVDKTLNPLISAYLFLLIIILPFDAYQFLKQPKNYITVHHINITRTD